MISTCCKAKIITVQADEGTGYYKCGACNEACDPVSFRSDIPPVKSSVKVTKGGKLEITTAFDDEIEFDEEFAQANVPSRKPHLTSESLTAPVKDVSQEKHSTGSLPTSVNKESRSNLGQKPTPVRECLCHCHSGEAPLAQCTHPYWKCSHCGPSPVRACGMCGQPLAPDHSCGYLRKIAKKIGTAEDYDGEVNCSVPLLMEAITQATLGALSSQKQQLKEKIHEKQITMHVSLPSPYTGTIPKTVISLEDILKIIDDL